MPITDDQIKILETHWRHGSALKQAQLAADCDYSTAGRKFAQFGRAGIPRSTRILRATLAPGVFPMPYTGPDMIGKAITPQPVPVSNGSWVF